LRSYILNKPSTRSLRGGKKRKENYQNANSDCNGEKLGRGGTAGWKKKLGSDPKRLFWGEKGTHQGRGPRKKKREFQKRKGGRQGKAMEGWGGGLKRG